MSDNKYEVMQTNVIETVSPPVKDIKHSKTVTDFKQINNQNLKTKHYKTGWHRL